MADPRIVSEREASPEVTYRELRELSYMGASVLHDEAIFPVREPGIPDQHPQHEGAGTSRHDDRRRPARPRAPCAASPAAGLHDDQHREGPDEQGTRIRPPCALAALEDHGVSFEHMPTGIDTISLIVQDEELANHGPAVLKGIERACQPDRVTLAPGLALIATVGAGHESPRRHRRASVARPWPKPASTCA